MFSIDETLEHVSDDKRSHLTSIEIVVYVVLAIFVTFAFVLRTGLLDLGSRSLIDTDGYMRHLRIDDLRHTWNWYDIVVDRSNYPFGEVQHWTRLLDIYVLALSFLLAPFLGANSLYWASVINAPLLLIGVGLATYWAYGSKLSGGTRRLLLPLTLAFPLVVGYGAAGRVDHHAALLLMFVLAIGSIIRTLGTPSWRSPTTLAMSLVLGIWLSTEYLVPLGLVALTLAAASFFPGRGHLVSIAARVFLLTSLGLWVVVLIERGSGWRVVEYDRVSAVHPLLALAIAAIFLIYGFVRLDNWVVNAIRLGAIGFGVAVPFSIGFPGLIGGPFVAVDSVVKEIWLYRVNELKPIWDGRSWDAILLVIGPVIVGIIAGTWQIIRSPRRPWVVVTTAWLVLYGVLAAAQVRWALFAHLLSLPLILGAIRGWYHRFDGRRLTVILRPFVIVLLIFGMSLIGRGLAPGGEQQSVAVRCELRDVMPALTDLPHTTVLAEQDVGPEILYRTNHRVIATPYHRNEEGILYPRFVMSLPSSSTATLRRMLAERDVGLILVCPGRLDIMQPEDPSGTFYEALVNGSAPAFVRPLELPGETDYLLFAVED